MLRCSGVTESSGGVEMLEVLEEIVMWGSWSFFRVWFREW